MDIKNLLYDEIGKIGREHIRCEITRDIYTSETIIQRIIKGSLHSLNNSGYSLDNMIGVAEGLLHFLLTVSLLPSSRKIVINNMEICILIPSSRYMLSNQQNFLIIQFINPKQENTSKVIEKLLKIQNNEKNIWLVSYLPLYNLSSSSVNFIINDEFYKFNNFSPKNQKNYFLFSKLLIEIDRYVNSIGYKGLKIL